MTGTQQVFIGNSGQRACGLAKSGDFLVLQFFMKNPPRDAIGKLARAQGIWQL